MRKNKSRMSKRNRLLGAAIGLIILVLLVLELTNTTHIFHKQSVPPVIPAHTNSGSPINSSSSNSATSGDSSSGAASDNTPLPADTSDHTLVTPVGNFVSNHFPGQNGAPTTEASVCNTSPGATCYIKFTNTSTNQTTQLASQVANAQGQTSWYWDVSNDAHLTSGKWKVTAVATLNGQTKTADDALNLTIQ